MSQKTLRVTVEEGHPVLWVDEDGYPILRQEHHPQAYMCAPWSTEAEALAWGETYLASLNA